MASELLKGKVIAIAGIVSHNSRLLSHDLLRQQITEAGGEWCSNVVFRCTHLVATAKEYEKRSYKVQQAEQTPMVKIVQPDWLLTSLEKGMLEDDDQYLHAKPATTNLNDKRPGSPAPSNGIASKAQKNSGLSKASKDAQAGLDLKGKIPADLRSPYKASHCVYVSEDGTVYDATVNLSLASHNSNKFHIIQVLQDVALGEDFVVWQRWGRVGEMGTGIEHEFKGESRQAIQKFEGKFRAKTGSKWKDRLSSPKAGKYSFVEKSYEDYDREEEEVEKVKGATESQGLKSEEQVQPETEASKSQLHPDVQFLMEFIFNEHLFESTLAYMSYDANKMPLGKLSERMLLSGFEILKNLADVIANETDPQQRAEQCSALSNQYFTMIPHVFGRRAPPIIEDAQFLERETELLKSLSEMEIATKIMVTACRESNRHGHILDLQYKGLNLDELTSLNSDSTEYIELNNYLTGSSELSGIKYKPKSMFRVSRAGEEERYNTSPYANRPDSHRLLLWHGSHATNYGGILSQGLRIAPPEAPVNGYMFGKGVYFADCSAKSAPFCYPRQTGFLGLLLLCEVDVGPVPMFEQERSNKDAAEESRAAGKTTTLGMGSFTPGKWKDAGCINEKLSGVQMPDFSQNDGFAYSLNDSLIDGRHLLFNEYIAYDVRQIRVRYLLLTQITGT